MRVSLHLCWWIIATGELHWFGGHSCVSEQSYTHLLLSSIICTSSFPINGINLLPFLRWWLWRLQLFFCLSDNNGSCNIYLFFALLKKHLIWINAQEIRYFTIKGSMPTSSIGFGMNMSMLLIINSRGNLKNLDHTQ